MQRPKRASLVVLAACAAAGVLTALFGFSASTATGSTARPSASHRTLTVTVTASEFKFMMSRTSIPVGTVVFKVVNRGKIGHNFHIAGKTTPMIAAGKSKSIKVVFKKAGRYAYSCTIPGHAAAGMKGVLGVGKTAPPPPPPTTTTNTSYPGPGGTVTVNMFEYGFTFSPATIPSGNVTFVMKNTGQVTHNFDIETVGMGAFVDPGGSATMTVNLQAGRTYTFVCDVPYHATSGMEGPFTPTP